MRVIFTTATTLSLLMTLPAYGWEETTDGVISKISSELGLRFLKPFEAEVNKPKVFIAEISSSVKSLDADDISEVVTRFETSISSKVVVLGRDKTTLVNSELSIQHSGDVLSEDIKALGEKFGASHLVLLDFKDRITKVDTDIERVKINAQLSVIDVRTERKTINQLVSVEFEHKRFTKSYPIQQSMTYLFGTTALVGLAGSTYLYSMASSEKYNHDDNETDAEKRKRIDTSKRYQRYGNLTLGATVLSTGLWLYFKSGRDTAFYHEYNPLTFSPFWNLHQGGLELAWKF